MVDTAADSSPAQQRRTHGFLALIVGEEALTGKRMQAGYILHIVDALAWKLTEEYAQGPVLTVSFDRVDMARPILHGDFVRLDGRIVSVGRTSMTVEVRVYTEDAASGRLAMAQLCFVTMVAVKPTDLTPVAQALPPLAPLPVRAQQFLERRRRLRADVRAIDDRVAALSAAELARAIAAIADPSEPSWPRVAIEATEVVFQQQFLPQHLNHNQTIFGGFLLLCMDRAATHAARRFVAPAAHPTHVTTASLESVSFRLPIFADDLVALHARVVLARRAALVVQVRVFVRRHRTGVALHANTGNFTLVRIGPDGRATGLGRALDLAGSDEHGQRAAVCADACFRHWREHRSAFRPDDALSPWPHMPQESMADALVGRGALTRSKL